jgi:hypothetical protein
MTIVLDLTSFGIGVVVGVGAVFILIAFMMASTK